jgi:hypothetical protein
MLRLVSSPVGYSLGRQRVNGLVLHADGWGRRLWEGTPMFEHSDEYVTVDLATYVIE